jgi:hypothetical protein
MTDHQVVSREEWQAARAELRGWVPGQLADGLLPHLHARDVTLLLVSQAPLAKLQAYEHPRNLRITGRAGRRRDTTSKPCPAKTDATPRNRLRVWPGTAVSTG